jgi:hypothetical protein
MSIIQDNLQLSYIKKGSSNMLYYPIYWANQIFVPITDEMVSNVKPKYLIGSFGDVLCTENNMALCMNLKGHGYYYVKLQLNDGSWKDQVVHRLVAMAFCCTDHPLCYYLTNNLQVNHMDGNKLNNHMGNLEWVTNLENMRHAIANNLIDCRLDHHYKALLTNDQVHAICKLLEEGKYTYMQINQILNLNLRDPVRYISEIKTGVKWKDISRLYNIDYSPRNKS